MRKDWGSNTNMLDMIYVLDSRLANHVTYITEIFDGFDCERKVEKRELGLVDKKGIKLI